MNPTFYGINPRQHWKKQIRTIHVETARLGHPAVTKSGRSRGGLNPKITLSPA